MSARVPAALQLGSAGQRGAGWGRRGRGTPGLSGSPVTSTRMSHGNGLLSKHVKDASQNTTYLVTTN